MRDLVAKVLETAPTWASPTTATPTASGSSTSRDAATRRTSSSPSSPAISLRRHPARQVVFDVKCSQVLDRRHPQARRTSGACGRPGHSHLKRKMREDGILLGGEVSGHMFFGENWYGVDDGILASCKFLELVAREPKSVSRALRHPAASLRHAGAQGALPRRPEVHGGGGARARAQGALRDGRHRRGAGHLSRRLGLVRASNTNPYLALRFEAKSLPAMESHAATGVTTSCGASPEVTAARLAHVAGVAEGVPPGLGPDGEPVRLASRPRCSASRPTWCRCTYTTSS